jgi:histidyl-tRNA synthetase
LHGDHRGEGIPRRASCARTLTKVEGAAIGVLERYAFAEIRLPIVERTELFAHRR